jgi:hypothetical protein
MSNTELIENMINKLEEDEILYISTITDKINQINEYRKEYYSKNREKIKEYQKEYYSKNREEKKKKMLERYYKNKSL